jgi:membrane associated rhomboid family serine protease
MDVPFGGSKELNWMGKNDFSRIIESFAMATVLIGVLWAVHSILLFLHVEVYFLGIIPRKMAGLPGILSGPLVHHDVWHLFSNTGPLFFFSAAMFYFYRKATLRAIFWIYIMTGTWVWVAAHDGSHIGASGLVYGFGAFLFFSGIFRRDVRSITLSLLIALFYGGMVWGVLPVEEGISWESHLFGAIAGIATAFYFRKIGQEPRKRYQWEDEPELDENDANAAWNYQQNWQGSKHVYVPEPLSDETPEA